MRVNKRGLIRALNELFANAEVTASCPAGVVRKEPEPLEVKPLLRKYVRTTDPEEDVFDYYSPIQILERVVEIQSLFTMHWTSAPGIDWLLELNVVRLSAERALMLYAPDSEDCDPVSFIAALEPADSEELLTVFLKDLFYGNGEKYGVYLMGVPPDEIWVDCAPKEAVFQAFWTWLKWSEKDGGVGLAHLADYLIERYEPAASPALIQQDPLTPSFAKVMPAAILEKWQAFVEERKRRDKRVEEVLTDDIERLILDYYLATSAFWKS